MKNRHGFSLIELLVTLSIASVLVSYALPSISNLRSNKTLQNERDRLTVSFAFARNFAITQQKNVVVCPSLSRIQCDNQSNWYQGWIVFEDTNRNRVKDENEQLLQYENPMNNIVKATSSVFRSKIRFNSVGFAPGTNVSINFCDMRGAEYALAIIINNAGRIKQSKPISDNVCN